MEKFKFNSQICTTIEQSKRLLELGLKPETADMVLFKSYDLPQYPFDYTFNQDPNALVNCSYVPMGRETNHTFKMAIFLLGVCTG